MFEDTIIGLDGLSLGDGRFLLALYLSNELHIYSPKHPSFQNVLNLEISRGVIFGAVLRYPILITILLVSFGGQRQLSFLFMKTIFHSLVHG
jgi:hypothetical protein